QPPDAAAERQPANAGRRDLATDRSQSIGMGRRVNMSPAGTAADARDTALAVDFDCTQVFEVEDDPVIADPMTGDAVPAAANSERHAFRYRHANGSRYVVLIVAVDDR